MNNDVRKLMRTLDLKQWQVAEAIGISPYTLSVWLRYELSPERRKRIQDAISTLSKGGKTDA